MKQILYTKYNRTRKEEFQIGTKIYTENGKKFVEKFATETEAYSHVQNIGENSKRLSQIYVNLKFQPVVECADGRVVFEYLVGENMADEFVQHVENKDAALEYLHSIIDKVFMFDLNYVAPFEKTDKFVEVFGDANNLEGKDSVTTSNIDMILNNMFVCEDGTYLIDNEWVFDFAIPVEFIKYRTLNYLYRDNEVAIAKWMSRSEFLSEFGIAEVQFQVYEEMENSLQNYVHGPRYMEKYVQNCVKFDELLSDKKEVEFLRDRVSQFQLEVEKKNTHINELDAHIQELDDIIQYYLNREKSLEEEICTYKDELEICMVEQEANVKSIHDKDVHIRNVEAEREIIRRERDALTNELHQIAYYRKHPLKRIYRIARRFGGKIYRRIKAIVKKLLPYRVTCDTIEIPKFSKIKVSIVIPVYNEFQYTYNCVKSIIENVKDVPYEIIVGDDESKDDTKYIKKIIKNIKVNINKTEHGFLMNCNRAAKLATGEYILFLNNDTVVKENWLESLVELIESDETIGMVGSKFIYPDGRLQEAGGIIWKDASAWNYGRYQNPDMPEFNYVRETDYISGASIMIRSSLWNEIGGFDERYIPAYCEDSDLAFEVRKHGYKVMYQPKSVVVHFEGVSNGTELDEGLKKYQVENNLKLKEKWAVELASHNENGNNPFCMRERNYDKKVILFIDHYVPTYDKDAGSKTTFQYIKMFLAKGYVVKFIGDNYAQMEPYTTTLQQMGVEVLYGPWYAEHIFEWIEANKEHIDFAYLNRPHISVKYLDFLREKTDIKLIYYGHDLHFLRTQREAEITGNQELLKDARVWKKKEFDIMKNVSMSYYPSYIEEEAIHEIDPNISVKAITAYVFDKFIEDYKYEAEKREGILFVGGFSHGPNADAVKWFVDEVYGQVREKKDIPFIIVGSNAPDEIKAMGERDGIIFKGFVSDEELAELYATAKMVIVPLRYGAGVKGKVVEAIYNGLPIVTTSVGAEGISGVEEVLCIEDEAKAFADRIVKLYDDSKTLETLGNKTQEFIKKNFSIDAVWDIVKDDFQ